MKAKELIKILKHDPEAEVIVTTDNFEMGHNKVALQPYKISKWKMKKVVKRFTDAFDHEHYFHEVFELDEKDGETVFLL